MIVVLVFAFVAGVLTILAPCTLPVVPLVLGGAATGGQRRSVGILAGFGLTFVAVTVIFASALATAGLTTDWLRLASVVVLALVGLIMAVGPVGAWTERQLAPVTGLGTRLIGRRPGQGLLGGLILGAAIGLVWAPCVGPIMAAVIATAVVHGPGSESVLIAVAFVLGALVPLSIVAAVGDHAGRLLPGAARRAAARQGLGVAMVVAAVLVGSGLDLTVENGITTLLPAGWSSGLLAVEQQPVIRQQLQLLGTDRPQPEAATMNHPVATGIDTTGPAMPGPGHLPAAIASSLPVNVGLEDLGPAPELTGITAWINSAPLTMASLRGKVVLVEFWTFACINCIHVQPYVKAWFDRYASAGLVVVGVHTPELSFERDLANVKDAVAAADVRFPVAFDPAFATWNAYHNAYWPAMYFIDRTGQIRHARFGEGDYEGSEQVIRELLNGPG